jgi:hypothetical protein
MAGTKRLVARYGERLVCVRYLYATKRAAGGSRPSSSSSRTRAGIDARADRGATTATSSA